MSETTATYDAVIVGGGHNGLACACYLAMAGKKVVVTEALVMATSTVLAVGTPVVTIVPEKSAKVPRTLLIRCRTVKPTVEWLGSTVQVPATRPVPTSSAVMVLSSRGTGAGTVPDTG